MHFQPKLVNEIMELIFTGTEGEYWDFKRQWYKKNRRADLLHDVLCMANNIVDHDCYVIIGVEDDGEVCGINEKDPNRMSQQNVIDFLRDKKFAKGAPTLLTRLNISLFIAPTTPAIAVARAVELA